jgi:GAF domain-containing protein/HAMP domain-containing protein
MRIKKFQFRISQKIMGGFLALIFIFMINAALGLFTLNKSANIIRESSDIVDPSKDALNEFNLLVSKSRMYITNWVYLRSNTEDKEALQKLHKTDYPELKARIQELKPHWTTQQQNQVNAVFIKFDSLLTIEQSIMDDLKSFDDYEDEGKKFSNQMMIDDDILPRTGQITAMLNKIIVSKNKEKAQTKTALLSSFSNLRVVSLTAGVLSVVIGLIAAFVLTRTIVSPINYIRQIIQKLGNGELPERTNKSFDNDEIGEMAQAVDKLVAGLQSTSLFAENIGNGNYQASFTPLSEHDVLGNALINMRNNLEKVAEDDKRRNWATEGMAKFSEMLRRNNDNINKLGDELISNLVKYVKANQGGFFIVNDTESDPFLELKSCYAWDKKKYIEQQIYEGEGLTGQVWQEQETIYLTEVPQNYITITSGLGEANPKSVLIVPLKVNDEIYGVIEMASFNEFAAYEIEFIEKIAESIASTVSTVKINERTQKLLEDSTILTEQMRAQEEEMRQNMEELQATQEEMERAQKDAKAREQIFDRTQFIIEFDDRYKITYANHMVQSYLQFDTRELIGSSIENVFKLQNKMEQIKTKLSQNNLWTDIITVKNRKGDVLQIKASAGVVAEHNHTEGRYLMILDGMEIAN